MSSAKKQTAKAAFEIKKGPRQVMTLSEAEVEKYLDLQELLNGLEDGFRGIELGKIQSPPRPKLSVAGKGFSLAMPAWRPGMQITVKIVNVFDGNVHIDLPNHLALINLFDPDTGATSCVMDGTYMGNAYCRIRRSFRAHAVPEQISNYYGDRSGCPWARTPATAAIDSGFGTRQHLLAAF
jgi:hypothetical protein